ncbi:MAG: acyl-[acyl-carrier-protein] thioesterase [Paludibacteraceae bacterium]|nr:acyl-[acyl-carrier-protein] thioesterase [Paludibacteraceae bacterium]
MKELHNRYTFFVYPQEIDGNEQLRLSPLESYLLNAAGLAAEENGFGAVEMIRQGITWVLSQLSIEMKRLPKQYESFEIETWVEDYGRLLTTRHFVVYDKQGEEMGAACSQWALIDIESRRPVNLQSRPDLVKFATGENGHIEKPQRIGALTDAQKVGQHKVSYSDIDYNNHTNSMKYVEWMLDTYPLEKLYQHRIRRFDINYLREALYGEEVYIYRSASGEGDEIDIRNTEGTSLCKAHIQFE